MFAALERMSIENRQLMQRVEIEMSSSSNIMTYASESEGKSNGKATATSFASTMHRHRLGHGHAEAIGEEKENGSSIISDAGKGLHALGKRHVDGEGQGNSRGAASPATASHGTPGTPPRTNKADVDICSSSLLRSPLTPAGVLAEKLQRARDQAHARLVVRLDLVKYKYQWEMVGIELLSKQLHHKSA